MSSPGVFPPKNTDPSSSLLPQLHFAKADSQRQEELPKLVSSQLPRVTHTHTQGVKLGWCQDAWQRFPIRQHSWGKNPSRDHARTWNSCVRQNKEARNRTGGFGRCLRMDHGILGWGRLEGSTGCSFCSSRVMPEWDHILELWDIPKEGDSTPSVGSVQGWVLPREVLPPVQVELPGIPLSLATRTHTKSRTKQNPSFRGFYLHPSSPSCLECQHKKCPKPTDDKIFHPANGETQRN